MLERVREKLTGWGRRPPAEVSPATLLFADHEEIQDIARQMARTKIEIDRSVLTIRSWARDLGRRLEDSRGTLTRADDLRRSRTSRARWRARRSRSTDRSSRYGAGRAISAGASRTRGGR